VTCSRDSGSTFRLGTTAVSCSAKDNAGNQSRGSFEITVRDKTPPVLYLPKDKTVIYPDPVIYEASATDQVDGQITPKCMPPSGGDFRVFPVGKTTTVRCTARDEAGNRAKGTFEVTVDYEAANSQQDATPPQAS